MPRAWPFVVAAMGIAAANFLLHLGASSLFVDEVYSWHHASTPLGDLIEEVRVNAISPPAYFAALHVWIGRLGADADWAMRLPSVLCAVALVPVAWDLARRMGGPVAGVVAAFSCALSPLVLDYAQQVRGYASAMLVCALVAWCALRAVERERAGAPWALAAGLLAALAYAIHYTTAFATVPFLGWLALRRSLPGWARAGAVVPLGLVGLLLLPLMIDQLESGRQAAISPFARLTWENVLEVLGTPWDSRAEDPAALQALAAAVTVAAVVLLARRRDAASRVIAVAAAGPVAAAFVATLVSDDAIVTRYTSISAPAAIVAVAVAVAGRTGAQRALAVAALALVAVTGTVRGHGEGARFADARAAIERIAADSGGVEPIVTPPHDVSVNLPVRYYVGRELPARAPIVEAHEGPRLGAILRDAPAVWYVGRDGQDAGAFFAKFGFHSERVARFDAGLPLVLTRAERD